MLQKFIFSLHRDLNRINWIRQRYHEIMLTAKRHQLVHVSRESWDQLSSFCSYSTELIVSMADLGVEEARLGVCLSVEVLNS